MYSRVLLALLFGTVHLVLAIIVFSAPTILAFRSVLRVTSLEISATTVCV